MLAGNWLIGGVGIVGGVQNLESYVLTCMPLHLPHPGQHLLCYPGVPALED